MKRQEAQSALSMFIQLGDILKEMRLLYYISDAFGKSYVIDHILFGNRMPLYLTVLENTFTVLTISQYPSEYPFQCPLKRISDCAEFITLLNWGLPSGNFEVNMKSGVIRYRDSVNFADTSIDDAVVKNLLRSSLFNIDHYIYAIYAFIRHEKSPRAAESSADDRLYRWVYFNEIFKI